MDNNTPNTPPVNMPTPPGDVPGKGAAIGSLVCGIIAVVFWFFGLIFGGIIFISCIACAGALAAAGNAALTDPSLAQYF